MAKINKYNKLINIGICYHLSRHRIIRIGGKPKEKDINNV